LGDLAVGVTDEREVELGAADLSTVARPVVVAVDRSTEMAIALVLRLSNSSFSAAVRPSSVVQTGVKSAGWLNSTAHLPDFQSWKSTVPSVVSALKSGASSPSRIPMACLAFRHRSQPNKTTSICTGPLPPGLSRPLGRRR